MTTQPTAPEPHRSRGRPRTVERRIPIGFPGDLLAEIQQAADAAGTTFSAEVIRRCRSESTTEGSSLHHTEERTMTATDQGATS